VGLKISKSTTEADVNCAVIGVGGVGGYYGGLLANQGYEVAFLARGAHLEALRSNGLQVKSIHGDFTVSPVFATDDPSQTGPVDLVLFCVKTYDTERAAQTIAPLIGDQTLVLSLQNGVDAADRIGEVIGKDHMLGGTTWLSSAVESPGIIRQVSQFRRIVFGPLDGLITPKHQLILEAFQSTGIDVELTTDIQKVLWTKFVFISAASSLGGLTRLAMGEYRDVPETRAMILRLMREVEAAARGQGMFLDPDVVEKSLAFMDGAEPHIRASMQLDVEAGKVFELESMIGVIGRKGLQVGVPTPTAEMIYASLLPAYLKAQNNTA
jgi:2-dehydropantoate 2-reductase